MRAPVVKTSYGKYATSLKGTFAFMLVSFIAIEIYKLTRPTYDWWECLINPLDCASQTVIDSLVNAISLFTNVYVVIIVGIAWLIVRVLARRT